MRKLVAIFLGVLLLALAAPSARASVVFMYSAPDQTYGWCAGYSYTDCESEADQYCRDAGGKDCRLAVECAAGAGAAAFSDDATEVKGFGASCHFDDTGAARWGALEACIRASQALCHTSAYFSHRGTQASAGANATYDRIWYTQIYLDAMGYDPGPADGQLGAKTRTAIRNFEAAIGMNPTGEVTDRTLELASYAGFGEPTIIAAVEFKLSHDDVVGPYIYGTAAKPAAPQTFTAWLGHKTDEQQRTALAVVMTMEKTKCTIPASKAEMVGMAGGWNVDCAEGPYFVVFGDNSVVITSGHGSIDTPPPPGPDNPHKPIGPGPGPGPVHPTRAGSVEVSAAGQPHAAGAGKHR